MCLLPALTRKLVWLFHFSTETNLFFIPSGHYFKFKLSQCGLKHVHWRWVRFMSNLPAEDMSIDIHFRASVFLMRASFTSWLGLRIMVPRELLKKFSLVLLLQVFETAVVLRRDRKSVV